MAARKASRKLTSLTDIYAFFRQNQTPITFLSPTPYNILGLGRWINKFEYINFFDSFDGSHPKITVPREHGPHEFRSIEDVNNYLLKHKEVRAKLKERGPGYLLLVMFDEETEQLAKELVRRKKLTRFQAEEIYKGNARSLVLGNYVLLEKIGAGGMGQVFKAEHRRMKRTVAIKRLPAATTEDKAAIARFEREVEAIAKLRHPNIVAADDADCANGIHFLVMELVEGIDLSALVKKSGPLSAVGMVLFPLLAGSRRHARRSGRRSDWGSA